MPITSGGGGGTASMATSVLRGTKSANSAFAPAAATPARSLDLGSANIGGGISAAVHKRSAVGDLKPVVGRQRETVAAALPPKKRLESSAVADSTGDAERDAYSSLARMRCVRSALLPPQGLPFS